MAKVTLRPHYQTINGLRFPAMFSSDCIKEALNYKAKPDDVFIVTYPKCGTTWMQCVALHIFRKGKQLDNFRDFFRMSPFIDALGDQGISLMPRPGALKTHLPYDYTPYSPDAKYIYVARNPKDCCTSLYYHAKYTVGFGYWDAVFDDFFELFMAGEVEYNDYFDHLMSWYPYRNDSQVFFTTYEDMKRNIRDVVVRLSAFLGDEYTAAIEKDNNVLNNILHFSSFEYMQENISKVYDNTLVTDEQLNDPNMPEGIRCMVKYGRSLNPPPIQKLQFVRKGIVGDWKNHLSQEQSERLSKKFMDRTRGTDIEEMYKNYI